MSSRVPAEAVVVMMTDWKESLSGSEKPKSVEGVCEPPSRMVMVLSVPAGAVFTAVTSKVMVFAD